MTYLCRRTLPKAEHFVGSFAPNRSDAAVGPFIASCDIEAHPRARNSPLDSFSLCLYPFPMKFSVSEISELIRHRRTVYPKDYTDRLVHREIVERVLTNGTWAPTHGMTQPWRFTVYSGAGRQALSDFLGAEYRRMTAPEKSSYSASSTT